jgi:hypothetical protein
MSKRIPLDNEVRENVILDMVALFMNQDIDPEEAQTISAEAIETLQISRGGSLNG